MAPLQAGRLKRIAIDEAHCCSQCGVSAFPGKPYEGTAWHSTLNLDTCQLCRGQRFQTGLQEIGLPEAAVSGSSNPGSDCHSHREGEEVGLRP